MKNLLSILAFTTFICVIGCNGGESAEDQGADAAVADDAQARANPHEHPHKFRTGSIGPSVAMSAPAAPPKDNDPFVEAAAAIDLQVAPWEEILKQAASAGRPTVLDVWALSCQPCMEEFPGLVKLHDEFGERLQCLSANVDYDGRRTRPPENYTTEARHFLAANAANFPNYLCSTPSDEVFTQLEIPSIPAVLVFDAEGNEVARFVDAGETVGFTYEKDVVPFVRQLIEESTPEAAVTETDPANSTAEADSPASAKSDDPFAAQEFPAPDQTQVDSAAGDSA